MVTLPLQSSEAETHLILVGDVYILAARCQRVRLPHTEVLSGDRKVEAESLCSRIVSKVSEVLQRGRVIGQ